MRLTPRENAFYDMLREAGRNVATSGEVLAQLLDPGSDRSAVAVAMRECEHRGDSITHRILRQLNKSFVTPFDREDIYRLAGSLDDVVDAMEEATDFLVVADVGPLVPLMSDQIRLLQRATMETGEAMSRLKTLQHLESYWIEVNRLENEADRVHEQAISRLFDDEHDPLLVIKWKEALDFLEQATDRCEDVANVIESIMVKHG